MPRCTEYKKWEHENFSEKLRITFPGARIWTDTRGSCRQGRYCRQRPYQGGLLSGRSSKPAGMFRENKAFIVLVVHVGLFLCRPDHAHLDSKKGTRSLFPSFIIIA